MSDVSAIGLSIGLLADVGTIFIFLIIAEAVALYFLTQEFLAQEQMTLYANVAFTAAWVVTPGFISFPSSFAYLFVIVWLLFLAITIILALVPLLMYVSKLREFNKLGRAHGALANDHQQIQSSFKDDSKKSAYLADRVRKMSDDLDRAVDLFQTAKRSPEVIIKSLQGEPQLPEVSRPDVNYVFLGMGGTGIGLTEAVIDYFRALNVFKSAGGNNFAFILYDTNMLAVNSLKGKYQDTEVSKMIYAPIDFSTVDEGQMLSRAPWLVGESVQLVQGSGNRRGVGYAAYNVKKEQFVNRSTEIISNLVLQTRNPNLMIIVLNSLGGGTGSGTFLQATIDLKDALQQRLAGNRPIILGFGITPRKMEESAMSANAFGALKELAFLFKKGVKKIGETTSAVSNPFSAYFLVSRENPSATHDQEIASGISHLLLDLGSGGFDPNDIRTIMERYGPESFSTFDVFDIYFPASLLSWYKTVGKPLSSASSTGFLEVQKMSSELLNACRLLVEREGKFRDAAEAFRQSQLNQFISLQAYRAWIARATRWRDELGQMVLSVSTQGSLEAQSLVDQVYRMITSRDTKYTLANLEMAVHQLNNIANEEFAHLRDPVATSVETRFAIADPDGFDIGAILNPSANLSSIMLSQGRGGELQAAYANLRTTLGVIGMTMSNVDYHRVKVPVNVEDKELPFIQKFNSALVSDDGMSVLSPGISFVLMAVASQQANFGASQFPRDDQLLDSIKRLAVKGSEARKSSRATKRFTVSAYWLINGIYTWKMRNDDEEPFMKDMKFLVDSYNQEVKNGAAQMYLHHALFYADPMNLARLAGFSLSSGVNAMQLRALVTRFWVGYDMFSNDIGVWGIMDLSRFYSRLQQIEDSLESFNKGLTSFLQQLESGLPPVGSAIVESANNLATATQRFVPELDGYREIKSRNDTVRNPVIAAALNELENNTLRAFLDSTKAFSDTYSGDFLAKLRQFKGKSGMVVDRMIDQSMNSIINVNSGLSALTTAFSKALTDGSSAAGTGF